MGGHLRDQVPAPGGSPPWWLCRSLEAGLLTLVQAYLATPAPTLILHMFLSYSRAHSLS